MIIIEVKYISKYGNNVDCCARKHKSRRDGRQTQRNSDPTLLRTSAKLEQPNCSPQSRSFPSVLTPLSHQQHPFLLGLPLAIQVPKESYSGQEVIGSGVHSVTAPRTSVSLGKTRDVKSERSRFLSKQRRCTEV